MEYKTLATKLRQDDFSRFKYICDKKGLSQSAYMRELILFEINNPLHQFVAGKNVFEYIPDKDLFSWYVTTDHGENHAVIENISAEFLRDLQDAINEGMERRASVIGQMKEDSVAISEKFMRNDK
jgi:hypothetical protein